MVRLQREGHNKGHYPMGHKAAVHMEKMVKMMKWLRRCTYTFTIAYNLYLLLKFHFFSP